MASQRLFRRFNSIAIQHSGGGTFMLHCSLLLEEGGMVRLVEWGH
jgi:hypothetical protein